MRQHSLEAAVGEAGIEALPVFREETGSTNSDALELAAEGAPAWTVVATAHQTAGRGRLGRSWVSAPGKLLQFSVILHPELPVELAGLVPLRAAVDLCRACEATGVAARAKWPNDVVVGGRKLAGILAESRVTGDRLEHVVLGVGVNVEMRREDFPPELAGTATSIALEDGREEPEELLASFLRGFREALEARAPDIGPYRELCDTLGRAVSAETVIGERVEGTAVDLDARGGLVVDTGDGRRTVAFGEVAQLD